MVTNLYTDGSSPIEKIYPSAYCVFKENKLIYTKVLETNLPPQDVEYLALIEALNLIKEEIVKDTEISIYSDCGYMILELEGKRNPVNQELFEKAKNLLKELNCVKLKQISRYKNIAGFYCEKRLVKLRREKINLLNPQPNPQLKKIRRRMIYKR